MTEIILARHGETLWNAENIFRGRADIGLSETGLKQAELLAEYLSGLKVEAIYSSPLRRARETALTIARYHKIGVGMASELIDLSFGEWEGMSRQEVKEKYKELYEQWEEAPEKAKMPSGESLDDARERAVRMVNNVIAWHNGTVILVSHRVVNKVLICALLGLDNSHFWDIKLDTCGITTFEYRNGRFVLAEHNNTCFLRTLQKTPLADF
ncbi:MAG: histidine phosphatase family protein [Chloroflexi bacterium]|nr:histidine phosphatase family protein [Chloroflexota bacterium]